MRDVQYWFVNHGLDSLTTLPGFVWNTDFRSITRPDARRLQLLRMRKGDRWVGHAFKSTDRSGDRLNIITGFYQCSEDPKLERIPLPRPALTKLAEGVNRCWLVPGTTHGRQPSHPVPVPPLGFFMPDGHDYFKGQTLVQIDERVYERIRSHVLARDWDPGEVPLFRREPETEQELVATFIAARTELGVTGLGRLQTGFPDAQVTLEGVPNPVFIEFELASSGFFKHGHALKRSQLKISRELLAVVCWIDDAPEVSRHVRHVIELRELLRRDQRIVW